MAGENFSLKESQIIPIALISDPNGLLSGGGGAVNTIYNADDTIAGNCIVDVGSNILTFNNIGTLLANGGPIQNIFAAGILSLLTNLGGQRTALDITDGFIGLEHRQVTNEVATIYVMFGSVAGRPQVHLLTAAINAATASNGQVLTLMDNGSGAAEYQDITNLYNADGSLSANRIVSLGGNDLTINGTGVEDVAINAPLTATSDSTTHLLLWQNGHPRTQLFVAPGGIFAEHRNASLEVAGFNLNNGSIAGRPQLHVTTAAVDAGTANAGEFLQLQSTATGESEFAPLPQPYEQTFDATGDWGVASGGFYEITILQATHGKTIIGNVQVWSGSTDVDLVDLSTLDRLRVNAAGDVLFRVTDVPDDRFAGKIVIS